MDQPASTPRWNPLSQVRYRVALIVAVGVIVGGACLWLLLPTWEDARVAVQIALGRSLWDINQQVANEPLPELPPGQVFPPGRPLPPRPVISGSIPVLPEGSGGPVPPPDGSNQAQYEMQRRQYEFYMQQLREAQARQSRQREPEGGASPSSTGDSP